MAGRDHGTESGEAEEDKAEDSVDEAEEGRAEAVGDELNNYDQRGEPSHQASRHHEDSPPGGLGAEDGMYEVISGLQEGEHVVTSGQFMLDSESQLNEAIQKMRGAATTTACPPTPG